MPFRIRVERAKPNSEQTGGDAEESRGTEGLDIGRPEAEPLPPRFFGGILVPLVFALAAGWKGFIQRDINLPVEIGLRSVDSVFTGTAAMWAGGACVLFSLALHLMFWVSRRSHYPAFWHLGTFVAVIGAVGCMLAALVNR